MMTASCMILLADAVRQAVPFPSTKVSCFRPHLVFCCTRTNKQMQDICNKPNQPSEEVLNAQASSFNMLVCLKFVSSMVKENAPPRASNKDEKSDTSLMGHKYGHG